MIKARKRITAGLLAFAFLATSVFTMPITAKAASSLQKISASTAIDAKYSFSPRFIQGVTYLEPFGDTAKYSYADDLWRWENNNYVELSSSVYYPIRVTSSSQKGKIGVWYRNVGEYQGNMLDMKITVTGWGEVRNPKTLSTSQGSKTAYPGFFFLKNNIDIQTVYGYVKSPTYRVEFYNKAGNKVAVSGHITFCDLDGGEYVTHSGFTNAYALTTSPLAIQGSKITQNTTTSVNGADRNYFTTVTFDNKSYIDYGYGNKTDSENFSTVVRNNKTIYGYMFSGDSIARFNTPAPIKSGPASVVAGDDVSYNVSFTVPKQPSDYLYSKFVLSDTLPNGLKYKSFSVADDTGKDVTSNFTGSINGQEFTLSAKNLSSSSFYFKGYTVTINATCEDKDYKDQQGSDGKVILKNQAKITAQNTSTPETKTSNTVNTEVKFKITTSTDGNGSISVHKSNGTIDPTSISGGTYVFVKTEPNAGYKEDKLYIDGDDNLSNHFYNITSNHTVYATFTPETDRVVSLEKWIHKDDVNMANGTPTVIFKLEGTDLNGKKHTYYASQELDERMLEGDYYIFKIGFSGLTAGTYTASEIKTSRYALDSVYEKKFNFDLGENEYIKLDDDVLNCDLVNNQNIKGKFLNKRTIIQGFSHNDLKVNVFGSGNTPVK